MEPAVVVVAEDEWLIRTMVAEGLADAGFTVIEAEDGDEAIELLRQQAPEVGVLFTDVHMPGSINGVELAHHTHQHFPWVSLLVASGLARPEKAMLPAGCRFVPKPYLISVVIDHLNELAAARQVERRAGL